MAKTHVGYFRRGGLDLSFMGAVVIALLVTAGTRARTGLDGSCAGGCWLEVVGVGVGLEFVGFEFSDANGRLGG